MIPSYKPYFTKDSLKYAHEAIDSTWISSHGKYLPKVKNLLEKINDVNYVIVTNNGTAANHLMAIALKFKYPNIKNLIVPSNVYVAAWNMFLSNPIYNLIPVDSDIETWNPNFYELEKAYKIYNKNTAFLAVHNVGNITPIHEIKKRFPEWIILEDNAQGFGGKYNNKISGSDSFVSAVSFYGNKTITTGEGGMFCTNDEEVFKYIDKARSHFISEEKFIFSNLGYNYRMTNIAAAILLGQLECFKEIQDKKKKIIDQYKEELSYIQSIKFQKEEINTTHSNWMFSIRFENKAKEKIDKLKAYLLKNNIESRPMFPPINYHKHLSKYGDNFPISKKIYETAIILPSYPDLLSINISYICDGIKKFKI